MNPKYVNNPLEQDFPEVEVEKNAKATFMENFEDYLEEEYGELVEASILDKVKDKASSMKDKVTATAAALKDKATDIKDKAVDAGKDLNKKVQKAVTGKVKLTPQQETWFELCQRGLKSISTNDKALWPKLNQGATPDVKELNDEWQKRFSDYHVVYCKDPCAKDPTDEVFISKAYPNLVRAAMAADTFDIKDILEKYKDTYGYNTFPVLLCVNRGKTDDIKARSTVHKQHGWLTPSDFGFASTTSDLIVIAAGAAVPGGSCYWGITAKAFKLQELIDDF